MENTRTELAHIIIPKIAISNLQPFVAHLVLGVFYVFSTPCHKSLFHEFLQCHLVSSRYLAATEYYGKTFYSFMSLFLQQEKLHFTITMAFCSHSALYLRVIQILNPEEAMISARIERECLPSAFFRTQGNKRQFYMQIQKSG